MVTLIVLSIIAGISVLIILGALIWAAIQDGKFNDEHKAG